MRLGHLIVLTLLLPGPASTRSAHPSEAAAGVAETTLAEVLAAHAEAMGELDRWRALESVLVSGQLAENSEYAGFRRWRFADGSVRLELDRSEDLEVTVVEATKAHRSSGNGAIETLADEHADDLRADGRLVGPLLSLPSDASIELRGRTETDSGPAWELRTTEPGRPPELWYLDVKTLLPSERATERWSYGRRRQERSYYSDWRLVDGLAFPFLTEHEASSTHRLERVETIQLDPPVEE